MIRELVREKKGVFSEFGFFWHNKENSENIKFATCTNFCEFSLVFPRKTLRCRCNVERGNATPTNVVSATQIPKIDVKLQQE